MCSFGTGGRSITGVLITKENMHQFTHGNQLEATNSTKLEWLAEGECASIHHCMHYNTTVCVSPVFDGAQYLSVLIWYREEVSFWRASH